MTNPEAPENHLRENRENGEPREANDGPDNGRTKIDNRTHRAYIARCASNGYVCSKANRAEKESPGIMASHKAILKDELKIYWEARCDKRRDLSTSMK